MAQASASNNKPIIAVCGATGFQGGSVVKHILKDGRFAVRGLTRNLETARARELAKQGVTLVKADFDDVQSMCEAFKGCYGAFAVTDFFEAFDREAQQGMNIADAAKAAGIKHLVWSTGDDVEYDIPYMKQKAAASAYMKKINVPHTPLFLTWYFSNVFLLETLRHNPASGRWVSKFPLPSDIPIPSTSPKDIGAYALAAFVDPSTWIGRDMRPCNEFVSPRQYAQTYAEVTGLHVDVIETTREEVLAMNVHPFPELYRWFLDMHEGKIPKFSTELATQLCPNKQSWRDYMVEHLAAPVEQPEVIECFIAKELSS